MKKVRIWLGGRVIDKSKYPVGGRRYPLVGLTFHEVEKVDELREVVESVEEYLTKNFYSVEIQRTPSLKRELFGVEK